MLENGVIKIADFGIAIYTGDNLRNSYCGTPDYMSPELVEGKEYSYSVDIWSVGVMAYEFLVGKTPFYKKYPNSKVNYSNLVVPNTLTNEA